jgi:predicted ArsR family transcriptional regulator
MSELSRSEIAVWLVLYRDTRNGTVRTSQANIARRAGTSVRGVKDALRNLTAAGLLRVVFQGGLNRGPSRYQVKALGKRTS